MKANETILQPILEGTKQYVVPLFQRTYSWKAKNWETFWNDLLALYENEDNRQHFIGAIVSMPIDMSPSGVNKFLLIDGQQRITTLFVILAAIRDLAALNDTKLSDQIHELYLVNKWAEGQNKLKLLPSQTDREHFDRIIHKKSQVDNTNNIIMVYNFFRRKLEGNDSLGRKISLEKMHSTLIHEIVVVSIVLDREENPYLIFESLNAKGEPLTQADLVRNYFLMRIHDTGDQEVAYKDFWLPMQDSLGNELTNFIWRFLNKEGSFATGIRQDAIYDEVKQILTRANGPSVVDFLIEMHTYSAYYLRIKYPVNEPNREIQKRLNRINRWEINTAYPFLISIYRDYCEEKLSSLEMCRILDIIESFVIRRFFCRYPTNILNKIFNGLYKILDKNHIVESIIKELLSRDWPSDVKFLEAWIDFPVYLSGSGKCRHILETLEQFITDNKEPVDLANSQITIEHIMPQTLNEEWENLLGNEASNTYDIYLHTIGNLTLTGNNPSMGNSSLIEKREVFRRSNFALNKDLADSIIWGEYIIKTRANKLGQAAIKIWGRPVGDEGVRETLAKQVDPTGFKPTGFLLFGDEYRVDNWRDMLLQSLSILAEHHGDEFAQMAVQVKTSKRSHIAYQPDNMNTPIKIPNTELWVEANQSSRSVLWVIRQALLVCGNHEDDFEAYW